MSIQTKKELEDFYKDEDPWDYENTEDDTIRKQKLVEVFKKIPTPIRVLDIGCGHGYITRDLPGKEIVGVDLSEKAIKHAIKTTKNPKISYKAIDMYNLSLDKFNKKRFDLIIITGVLYPQYIGESKSTIMSIIDDLLADNGYLISVHVDDWYETRFPYVMVLNNSYHYRDYEHVVEVYKK